MHKKCIFFISDSDTGAKKCSNLNNRTFSQWQGLLQSDAEMHTLFKNRIVPSKKQGKTTDFPSIVFSCFQHISVLSVIKISILQLLSLHRYLCERYTLPPAEGLSALHCPHKPDFRLH